MANSNGRIAVVGLGCVLPDAKDTAAFWGNMLRGHSALRPLSSRTYDWRTYGRECASAQRVFAEPLGAEIHDEAFNWRKFRISPVDAQAINPMHLHVMEAGAQAIEGVKQVPHGSTGVFVGGTGLGWRRDAGFRIRLTGFLDAALSAGEALGVDARQLQESLRATRATLEGKLRPVSDDGVVNSLASIAAGRLALRFDLRGPHAGIDAGFASGLATVASSMRLLLDGTIDLALAGAASEAISPLELLAFHKLGVLAPHQVRPFDEASEGTLLGEGVAFFALKRLDDAIRDGETIYAVLCGTGASSDGGSGSLLAPSVEGQSLAMRRAYTEAEIDPGTIGYVECHATGTPIGDATELRTLAQVFGNVAPGVVVGSAKPFVGHLRGASGAVGLLRAVLALHHRVIPAQIGFETPHPGLGLESTPFIVPIQQRELAARGGAHAARCAVSSFGLGGINYHAVLEAFEPDSGHERIASGPGKVRQVANDEPIAIIGLGGVLPNADNISNFWKLLLDGDDTTREVPSSRWNIERYYDSDQKRPDTSYTRIGCFVEPLPQAGRELRLAPIARNQTDPGHVLACRAAEEAVADAGLETGQWDRARTAVIFGFIPCQGRRHLAEARLNFREFETEFERTLLSQGVDSASVSHLLAKAEELGLADLPPITEDTLPGYLGSFNAARIARRFDLKGPHFAVESACASSLAALHAAARLLRQGVVDTAIVGGVWADGQPEFFVQNCRFSALSPSGITPFDERASGFVPGEGAAVLILRRQSDAERDSQRIHALIRSVEGSTDGGAGRSVYAPSPEGESLAAKRALDAAGVDPSLVDYVECHGTGTALGDVVEVDACTRAYGASRKRPLLIGSVKSNIGHLMAGAGAAALLKTTLAVREGVIPSSLKVQKLNPNIDFGSGPVEVVTATRTWVGPEGNPRRAGVSGFGLGGTNYHVLLEQYRPCEVSRVVASSRSDTRERRQGFQPIAVAQGTSIADCTRAMKALVTRAQRSNDGQYVELLAENQAAAADGVPCRLAIVANEPSILAERVGVLEAALTKGHDVCLLRSKGIFFAEAPTNLRTAAMFPGQGPQYPNMLCEAAEAFPSLARSLDRIDHAYENICGRKLRASYCTEDPDNYLQSDEDIHCAVFGVNVALFELLESYGARIDAVMGQSAGELSALVAARTISLEDGLRAVRERTLAVLGIQSPDPGSMVALSCGAERASHLLCDLPGYAALAADNGPSACIVSGDRAAVDALIERAANAGIKATVLPVSHGYHSQLIAAARPPYRHALESMRFDRPSLDLYSTITGTRVNALQATAYPAHLESQFVEPVRLRQAVMALHRDGVRLFVECGPKWPLTTFVSEILTGLPYVAQAMVHPKVGEVEQLRRALACLFVHRVCSLSTVREASMRVQNIPSAEKSQSDSHSVVASTCAGREAILLDALRSIRDLLDRTLSACEACNGQHQGVLDARAPLAPETVTGVESPCIDSERSQSHDSDTVSNLVSSPSTGSANLRLQVEELLVAELVKRTGYPQDMLEPDLDLEAELGIDTVKQVASLAAVREHFGLAPDPAFRMQQARCLRQAVEYLSSRIGKGCQTENASDANGSMTLSRTPSARIEVTRADAVNSLPSRTAAPLRIESEQSVAMGPTATRKEVVPPAPSNVGAAQLPSSSDAVARLLIGELVNRTGYPEDMLELDLDLEAELGIDTVKQVGALAAVRERFGLPQDPQFRMQEARTLRQAIAYLEGRIQAQHSSRSSELPQAGVTASAAAIIGPAPASSETGQATPTPPVESAAAPREPTIAELATALNQMQEYVKSLALLVTQRNPVEPCALPALAPEIASAPRASSSPSAARRSVYPEVLLESILPQAGCPQSDEALELTGVTIADNGRELPREEPRQADVIPLHARDAEGQIVAGSRHIRVGKVSNAPASTLVAVKEGRTFANERLLRDYLEKSGRVGTTSIEWAYSQGFTTTVGGGHMPADSSGSRAMLNVLSSCFDVASFAWFGFTGALHSLSGIARVCFHRVPEPGAEILIWARMAHPVGGFWRADVSIFDPHGNLFAEVFGMEGTPLNGLPEGEVADPAERAWRRFALRTGRDSTIPEEIAS